MAKENKHTPGPWKFDGEPPRKDIKMSLELIEKYDDSINVTKMKDGDIAVIVSWAADNIGCKGRIVQRHRERLITIGQPDWYSWSAVFEQPEYYNNCKVRLLRQGETLKVT